VPLYPYRCTECGHRFEKIQSFSAEPETVCPKCGNAKLVRILTAPGLQFKGAGWYVNDYSSKSSTSTDGASTDAAKPAAESKPAPAAESASKPAASTASSDSPSKPAASSNPNS
jgi:putative FmdB family regulatory protein